MFQYKKIIILSQVCSLSLLVFALKMVMTWLGFEIPFSSILPALISSVIFFLGFILNGVFIDYKEVEKIPDEIAISVEIIFDQCCTTYQRTHSKDCLVFIRSLLQLLDSLDLWFMKKNPTRNIMLELHNFNDHILKMEKHTQPVFINKMKEEVSNLRRYLLRAYSIRETEFLGSSHVITLIAILFVFINLIVTKYDSFFESFLYIFGFSTIFIFMFKLIYDLDNPLDYYSFLSKYKDSVSLQPLYDVRKRMSVELKILEKRK